MSNSAIVTLATSSGEVRYKKLSARLQPFYTEYPLKSGYRVLIRQTDSLSYEKGLLQLYETAIRSGHKPETVGLPSLNEKSAIVFEATLVGKDGDTIKTATALKKIEDYKDWEVGETAAFQRLLASLGFGGEVLDADENDDLNSRGINVLEQPPVNATPEINTTEERTTVVSIARPTEKMSQGSSVALEKPEPPKDNMMMKKDENIPRSTIRQIERMAKMLGKKVPEFGNLQEALTFLLELQQQANDSKPVSV